MKEAKGNLLEGLAQYVSPEAARELILINNNMAEKEFINHIIQLAKDHSDNLELFKQKLSELCKEKFNIKYRSIMALEEKNESFSSRRFNFIPSSEGYVNEINPEFVPAYNKLMSLKGKIAYQRARGRAARSVFQWVQDELVDTGFMTVEELESLPMFAFQRFDPRLAMAFHKARARK